MSLLLLILRCQERGWLSLPDDLPAQSASVRSDVDNPVGGAHDFLVVLHHDNRIAQVAQLLQNTDELLGVATVQSDAWFVQDIQTAHQAAAQ